MFQVEIAKCRYKLDGLDIRHMWPTPSMQIEEGPILVSELDNQEFYVDDGRHRLIRAQLHGKQLIDAEWYEDWLADQEAAVIKKALAGPFGKPVASHSGPTAMGYPVHRDDLDVATVRRNAGMPPYAVEDAHLAVQSFRRDAGMPPAVHYPVAEGGNSYPSFNDGPRNTGARPYDAVVLENGEVLRPGERVRTSTGTTSYDHIVLSHGEVVRPRDRVVDGHVEQRHIPTAYRAKCGRDHLHQAHHFGEHMEEWCNGHPAPTYL